MRHLSRIAIQLSIVVALVSASASHASAFSIVDWFKHWNVSLATVSGAPEVSGPAYTADFTLVDDGQYVDYLGYVVAKPYPFHLRQTAVSGTPEPGLDLSFGIPFYYTRTTSVGLYLGGHGLSAHPFDDNYGISGRTYGIYVQQELWRLALQGYLGLGTWSATADLGTPPPYSPNDPGPYFDGQYYPTSTHLRSTGTSEATPAWGVAARIRFLHAVYVEAGLQHWNGGTIRFKDYKLGSHTVNGYPLPMPIEVKPHEAVTVGIGFGY